MALLFLEATATFEVGYTLTLSYVAFGFASAIALPLIIFGWMRLPVSLRVAAGSLVVVYVAAFLLGQREAISSISRAGEYRDVAYVADLVLGVCVVGLSVEIANRRGSASLLVFSLAGGAALATAYALYQWFALHYGWPFADVNNAVNTSGLSSGAQSQGAGIFGWERTRGTFIEPQYLAQFLASSGFLVVLWLSRTGRRFVPLAAGTLVVAAIVLTSSAPGLGSAVVAALASATVWCIARGAVRPAVFSAAALAAALSVAVLVAAYPSAVGGLTGRSGGDLSRTTDFRTKAWDQAVHKWTANPVIGFGPGQASVQLAERARTVDGLPIPGAPVVLGSAHGLWAAALVDAGALGLAAWVLTLGGLLLFGVHALLRSGTGLGAAVTAAGFAAVIGALIGGDRLEVRTWAVLALLAAAASCATREQAEHDHEKTSRAT